MVEEKVYLDLLRLALNAYKWKKKNEEGKKNTAVSDTKNVIDCLAFNLVFDAKHLLTISWSNFAVVMFLLPLMKVKYMASSQGVYQFDTITFLNGKDLILRIGLIWVSLYT